MNEQNFAGKPDDLVCVFRVQGEKRVDKHANQTPKSVPLPRHRGGERFIRGPIPLAWFKSAAECGGRAEAVAVLLWYAAGCQRRNPVKLTRALLGELKVHPKTAKRVLQKMSDYGLVQCEFARGRSPLVTIVDPRQVLESS